MIKKLLISTGLAACLICACAAQTNYSTAIPDHGEPVLGVWLAIESSTNAAVTGSEISLRCSIKNSSTNDVGIPVSNPMALFEVILTNRSGEIFVINDPTTVPIFMNHIVKLGTGEIREFTIPIGIKDIIKAGDYKMAAKGRFYFSLEPHKLVSNSLDLKIQKEEIRAK